MKLCSDASREKQSSRIDDRVERGTFTPIERIRDVHAVTMISKARTKDLLVRPAVER
jgi:hypothetical protein